ncbi:hypothetical protein ACIPRD_03225 [Streptomyces sp. NPDC090108]|uniref:hypothetical protein n=1 Tax=Streptomyces sp. NPDC090108 TaxID=3365947 RepID=UPI00382D616D
MNDDIRLRLEAAGLEVVGPFSGAGSSVAEAFHRVVNVDAEPVETIPRDCPEAANRVSESWQAHAQSMGVLSEDGSFLAAGSLEHGWIHVKLTPTTSIFSTQDQEGDLLFISRSPTGNQVCAASGEGAEYWILAKELT